MRANSFQAIEHIKGLNLLQQRLNKPITAEKFRAELKKIGIPSNYIFWLEFKRTGLVMEITKGAYIFANSTPIHHTMLQNIYKKYQEKLSRYSNPQEGKIEAAIKLLKENGFEILIPRGELYQKI